MTDDKVVRVIGASGKLHAFRNLKSLRQPDGIPGAFKMFYAVPGAVDLAGHYEFLAESPVKKRKCSDPEIADCVTLLSVL